jgi:hypothetical protein
MRTMIMVALLCVGACTAEVSSESDAAVACGVEGAVCCAEFPACNKGLQCESRPEARICVPPPRPALAGACRARCAVAANCGDLPPHGEIACFRPCIQEWEHSSDDTLRALEQCLVERQDDCAIYETCWVDRCGALGEACCPGEVCDDDLACGEVIGTGELLCGAPSPPCGGEGQPCCAGPRPCDHLAELVCNEDKICIAKER